MDQFRIVKVQTPALQLRLLGREFRFGAHNFIVVFSPAGKVIREIHGIAKGPGGAQLRIYGGIVPFRPEFIFGEHFPGRTGFYDERHPQAELFTGDEGEVMRKLAAAEALKAAVNARAIRYPWPALFGANSNAYYATALAAMGLTDVRAPGQLWAPSIGLLLLPREEIEAIRTAIA